MRLTGKTYFGSKVRNRRAVGTIKGTFHRGKSDIHVRVGYELSISPHLKLDRVGMHRAEVASRKYHSEQTSVV